MAQYRFIWGLSGGTGSITVNGDVPQPFYEEGTSITILGTFDSGFVFSSYDINSGFLNSNANPWTFTMPTRDIRLRVNLTGSYSPSDADYQLKYFTETCDQSDQHITVQIYELGYEGSATQKDSSGFVFRWGNFGQDEIDPIVRSYFNFGLVGMRDEYFELLEGGDRKWQVRVLIGGENNDITNWQAATPTGEFNHLAFGNNIFVGVNLSFSYSYDGINWTLGYLLSAQHVTFGNGQFISVGHALSGGVTPVSYIYTSPDGRNWTSRNPSEAMRFRDISYGNGLYVTVASEGTNRIMTSPNGITWTSRTTSINPEFSGVAYGNGKWVAVTTISSGGTTFTSYDGITWTERATIFYAESIFFANGLFVTGNQWSEDGINWSAASPSINPRAITFGNGYFVGVTNLGTNRFFYSTDGKGWTSIPAASNASFRSVTFGNNTFVAGATNGTQRINYLQFLNPLFWKGYINNSTLTINEIGIKEVMQFTASDGLNAFDSKRVIEQYFLGFLGGSILGGLFGTLNQTFRDLRPINVACEIYETRLDRDYSVFDQLLIPPNAVYTDGDIALYFGNGEIAENTSLYISEFLEAILKPFLCRVFLWRNEFYVISLPELAKDNYRLFNFDNIPDFKGISTISSGMDVSCKFTNGQRTGRPVYTEFTGTLELGVLDYSSRGGIYEEPFSVDSWYFRESSAPNPSVYQLRAWGYVNAIPSNQPTYYPLNGFPFFEPAFVQYVSSSLGDYAKIWGTSSVIGIDDDLLSFIELDSTRTGNDIDIAQELSNTLSFQIEFLFEPRSGIPGVDPVRVNTNAGIQIKIGDSYLSYDGDVTFTWTTTETIMQFPMEALYAWNKVDITNIVVPEDGAVIIRLYETITTNAASVNRYTLGYRNMSLKIEENNAFATSEISEKFITDESYSNVYSDVKFQIGDVDTENSSSAIRLDLVGYGYPNSQTWSRDGIESSPLIQIFLQELANIKGKQNPRLILTLPRDAANPLEIKPYQNIEYDGHYWMVIAMEVDLMANSWRVELARLDIVGS